MASMLSRILPSPPLAGVIPGTALPAGSCATLAWRGRPARGDFFLLAIRYLTRATLELAHEVDQRLDARERHGIIEACAHAADAHDVP